MLDTDNITVTGNGTVDLGKEQIDYVLLPKKKSRLILKADPVKIAGPLDHPSTTVIPWKSAVTTYGTLFFAPYVFVGVAAADYLSGLFEIRSKESPCLLYERMRKEKRGKPASAPTPFRFMDPIELPFKKLFQIPRARDKGK